MPAMIGLVTNALLAIGTGVVVLNALLLVATYGPGVLSHGQMFDVAPDVSSVLVRILAFAGSLFGLRHMWVTASGSR